MKGGRAAQFAATAVVVMMVTAEAAAVVTFYLENWKPLGGIFLSPRDETPRVGDQLDLKNVSAIYDDVVEVDKPCFDDCTTRRSSSKIYYKYKSGDMIQLNRTGTYYLVSTTGCDMGMKIQFNVKMRS